MRCEKCQAVRLGNIMEPVHPLVPWLRYTMFALVIILVGLIILMEYSNFERLSINYLFGLIVLIILNSSIYQFIGTQAKADKCRLCGAIRPRIQELKMENEKCPQCQRQSFIRSFYYPRWWRFLVYVLLVDSIIILILVSSSFFYSVSWLNILCWVCSLLWVLISMIVDFRERKYRYQAECPSKLDQRLTCTHCHTEIHKK